MRYSKQKVFCNTCGKEMFVAIATTPFNGRFCSQECCNEFRWRETLSIMGEDYCPNPKENESK